MRNSTYFRQFVAAQLDPPTFEPLGAAEVIESGPAYLRLRSGSSLVEIAVLAPDLFRVGCFGDGRPASYASEAVLEQEWRPGPVDLTEGTGATRLATPAASVQIQCNPLRIAFARADGRPFAEDEPGLGMGFLPLRANGQPLIDPIGSPVRAYKRHRAGTHYFGCGERTGGLEKTDSHQIFWNIDPPSHHTASLNNLYTSVPFVLALEGGAAWGLFFDNPLRSEFDLAREDPSRWWFGADGGDLIYYVFAGPTPRVVLERYTELTGRTPLPPLWALGNHQSRWGYRTADEVRKIAREFRERDIPCDALHLDIDYMDGYRVFTWDQRRFPDPQALTAELHQQGFRVVSIVDPGVKVDEGFPVYTSGRAADAFCKTFLGEEYRNVVWPGVCAFPDFTSPAVRAWWGDLHVALLENGVDGIWCDMNEPTMFIPTPQTLPPDVTHGGGGAARLHAEVHNLYGQLMARATREGLERLRPDRRPFVISRSGFAGLQRYALHWTGDNSSWWEHLAMSVPQLQNLGLSGLAWVGVDIGGFSGDTTGELLARWIEFGIFQPFCRNHSAWNSRAQEPWAFGERYEAVIRRLLKLRQRLLPYLYSVFEESHRTGAPILRPLLFDHPGDETAYTIEDEFLFGPALLVAPIARPGVEHRHVYLPAGSWFHLWTGQRHDGPTHLLVHAPLGQPAVFVRANTPVPLWPEMSYVGERAPDPLTLLVYSAEGEGTFELYEDAGDGYEHLSGGYARTIIHCDSAGGVARLRFEASQGSFRPPRQRIELDLRGLVARPTAVRVDGATTDLWHVEDGAVRIQLEASGAARTVEVRA